MYTCTTMQGGFFTVLPYLLYVKTLNLKKKKIKPEIMENQNECEGCFYQKVRDVDQDTGKLSFGPFCLKTGQPVRCEQVSTACGLSNQREEIHSIFKALERYNNIISRMQIYFFLQTCEDSEMMKILLKLFTDENSAKHLAKL
jgi:hypothetical protein